MTGTQDSATQHEGIDAILYVWTGETGSEGAKWLIALWIMGQAPFVPLVWVMLHV